MTVAELIKVLSKMPQDAKVEVFYIIDDWTNESVYEDLTLQEMHLTTGVLRLGS